MMVTFEYDVLLSYFRPDQNSVSRVCDLLQSAGLRVWWDRMMSDGTWDDQIFINIEKSRKVVVFLTDNMLRAEFDNVLIEMKRARLGNKLIPVIVGNFSMYASYEGVIGRLQHFKGMNFDELLENSTLATIAKLCKSDADTASFEVPSSFEPWRPTAQFDDIAFAIALATLEGCSLSMIAFAASDLKERFITAHEANLGKNDPRLPPTQVDLFARRSRGLTAIGGEVYDVIHPRFGTHIQCGRYKNEDHGRRTIEFIWTELDQIHGILVQWLDKLCIVLNADGRTRLGVTLGLLAQGHFVLILDLFVMRWMRDKEYLRRELADIILAVAANEETVKIAIKRLVLELSHASDKDSLRAAVELACGYTGMNIEDLPISTLRSVAKSNAVGFEILHAMQESIEFLIRSNGESGDNSLFSPRELFLNLAEWAQTTEDGTPEILPLWLFLRLTNALPFNAPDGTSGLVSMTGLLKDKEIRKSAASVFNIALAITGDNQFSPRDDARIQIRNWLKEKSNAISAELLALLREIYFCCNSDRDRDRLAHLVREWVARTELEKLELNSA